ncbi:MAG TPA: hypothetical protein VF041_20590 [Gemmatimonadaceae bacterium]
MNDKQLIALAKKNAAKAAPSPKSVRRVYDATLEATRPAAEADDGDAAQLFKEMKRREF